MSVGIGNQRVVDRFDGDSLDERWLTNIGSGSATFAMIDAIDEGFSIETSLGNNANGEISFGNKKQYDGNKFKQVSIWRRAQGEGQVLVGITDEPNGILGSSINNQFNWGDSFPATFKGINFNDGTPSGSVADSSVPIDTLFHRYKLEVDVTTGKAFIDGLLEITVTTDLPTGSVQNAVFVRRFSAGGVTEGQIRYCEVYNF